MAGVLDLDGLHVGAAVGIGEGCQQLLGEVGAGGVDHDRDPPASRVRAVGGHRPDVPLAGGQQTPARPPSETVRQRTPRADLRSGTASPTVAAMNMFRSRRAKQAMAIGLALIMVLSLLIGFLA